MRFTQRQLLDLTHQVFVGAVTREQLGKRSNAEKAFVGTAVMLALRDRYLDEDNRVKSAYSKALENLVSAGVVNPIENPREYADGDQLVRASQRLGLYTSTGRGVGTVITLTPPPQLVALVNTFRLHVGLAQFLHDATTGVQRQELWRAERDRQLARQARMSYIDIAISTVERRHGEEGLRELLRRLQERFRQSDNPS